MCVCVYTYIYIYIYMCGYTQLSGLRGAAFRSEGIQRRNHGVSRLGMPLRNPKPQGPGPCFQTESSEADLVAAALTRVSNIGGAHHAATAALSCP